MGWLRRWRRERYLRHARLDPAQWQRALTDLPLVGRLSPDERARLQQLVLLFLHEKSLEGAQGFDVDADTALCIAIQACLPILNLGIDWLDGWVSVVVHPDEFLVDHEAQDEAGVVHRVREARSGEAWERGPLVLSASDVAAGGALDGYNVVVHEIAHKLDSLNGAPDGFPPLHRDMPGRAWTEAFTHAFEALNRQLDAGEEPALDPYAAEAPEEFFAVTSEYFFELPDLLNEAFPAVYRQLAAFYRQDPLAG